MTTIVAKKAIIENPIALDDEHYALMAADPSIVQFPQGSTYGSRISIGPQTNLNQSLSNVPVLTGSAPSNAASDAEILVKADEHWVNSKWRPAMGWMYMSVCITDFILFPILWSILQAIYTNGNVTHQWQPLTLQGAGLFHIAMGAVLGITAYGRTKEKVEGRV